MPQIRARTYPGKGRKKDRGSVAGGITAATLQVPEIHSARGEVRFLIVSTRFVACLLPVPGSGVRQRAECCYGSSLHGVRRE